ncbi:alpha/beta fold hydrolase [Geodermatophilus ruber]|uniref:Lysophospholipase, alpha-beta hydrolase superfamily n=1 Tax=Geodermatophilus ruber TaxID=504800 RepID=A0A1I4FK00_9ACTN|nr:alpha/beta fold hydrolase [Geodermatophilus ruber]SFL17640.1 Lysophospholipase, alpha-beta hydrolase superfamily [Geodermatophilus ruber]
MTGPAPHELADPVHRRRGAFWLPGDLQHTDGRPWQLGPAWVQWEAPAELTGRPPIVFVHGGGSQSTDWLGTTGAPVGWAELAVRAGYPVYLLDRPGYGRSPWDPARLGGKTPFPDYPGLELLVPRDEARAAAHTAWPWGRTAGSPHADAQVASSSGMLRDLALSQELDARRLVDLLDRTGPAVLVAASAGAPSGWLAADRRPGRVRAVVALEPLGPPHRDLGPLGRLSEGLTAVPLTRSADGTALPCLATVPVCVVTAEASGRAEADRSSVRFLRDAGVPVDHLDLVEHGVTGSGHGLAHEENNADAWALVASWIEDRLGPPVRR